MEELKTKTELIVRVRSSRAALVELLVGVEENQLEQPGVEANWSVKDIIAHITAWESKLCAWLGDAQRGSTPSDRPQNDADVHAMNAAFDAVNKIKTVAQVLVEFEASAARVIAAVTAVPEPDFFDTDKFQWLRGKPLWYLVGGDTFWHYEEHMKPLRLWLEQKV